MDLLQTLLGPSVAAAIVSGLFALIQWRRNRKAQCEDRAAQRQIVDCTARGEEIQAMRAMVESLITAQRAVLYDRIKFLAKSYIKRSYITVEEYEDLTAMHAVYHNELKGNGFLDSLMKDVDRLEKRVL